MIKNTKIKTAELFCSTENDYSLSSSSQSISTFLNDRPDLSRPYRQIRNVMMAIPTRFCQIPVVSSRIIPINRNEIPPNLAFLTRFCHTRVYLSSRNINNIPTIKWIPITKFIVSTPGIQENRRTINNINETNKYNIFFTPKKNNYSLRCLI